MFSIKAQSAIFRLFNFKKVLDTERKLGSVSKRKQIHKSSCFHYKRVLAINDTITMFSKMLFVGRLYLA